MIKMLMIPAAAAAAMLTPTIASAQTPAPAQFVMKAGASDLYEQQSSQLVMKSSNAKVRNFAQMMVRDHTKSTADVKAAATRSGVRPTPPKLEPMQAQNIAKLRAASGTSRDQMYIDQQKMAHEQALALHTDYAANGTAPALKAAAGKIAPVVQHHIEELNAM